jgi:predicted dithiol-disulfide oxidoreductase (DUF899 family)
MNLPQVVSRDEWLAARKELLTREKELTRARDTLNADRRRLPMVLVDKPYRFQGQDGEVGLLDLFDGSRQLIVQHTMWLADDDRICPGCTAGVDEMSDGIIAHLRARDTNFVLVARGPLADLQRYQAERGWTIPMYSSLDSDFNYDFHVTLDEAVAPVEYNYRSLADWRAAGRNLVDDGESAEQPGFSCFLRDDDGLVFHTYSTYARGTDNVGSAYDFLDLTALGRQEEWEEPKGRAGKAWGSIPDFAS